MPITRGQVINEAETEEIVAKIQKLLDMEERNAGIDAKEDELRCFLNSAIVGCGLRFPERADQPGSSETKSRKEAERIPKKKLKKTPGKKLKHTPEKKVKHTPEKKSNRPVEAGPESNPGLATKPTEIEAAPKPTHGRIPRSRPGREQV